MNNMRLRAIRIECKRCFDGKWFWLALAAATALAVAAALDTSCVVADLTQRAAGSWGWGLDQTSYVGYSNLSRYSNWMVPNANASLLATIFPIAMPALALIPYAWSYISDIKTGYASILSSKCGTTSYATAKLLAAFLSAFLVTVIPLLLNYALISCATAGYPPVYEDYNYLGIHPESHLSWFFYNMPDLYVVLHTLLDGVLLGMWAAFATSISSLFSNRVALLVGLPSALYAWRYLSTSFVIDTLGIQPPEINIVDALSGQTSIAYQSTPFAIAQVLVLAALSLLLLRNLKERVVL